MPSIRQFTQDYVDKLDYLDRRMTDLAADVGNITDELKTMERHAKTRAATLYLKMDSLEERVQVLETTMIKNKAFLGGIIFSITCVSALITSLAHYFKLI